MVRYGIRVNTLARHDFFAVAAHITHTHAFTAAPQQSSKAQIQQNKNIIRPPNPAKYEIPIKCSLYSYL